MTINTLKTFKIRPRKWLVRYGIKRFIKIYKMKYWYV